MRKIRENTEINAGLARVLESLEGFQNLFLKMGTNPFNDHFRRSPWGFFSRLQVNVTNLNRAPKFLNFPTKLQS